jgi:class 3 adenylate cyclase
MDDIRAVMDAAQSPRALLVALGDGGPLAMLFAATYPERTAALVLINTAPRAVRSPEIPWQSPRAQVEQRIDEVVRRWGEPDVHEQNLTRGSPDMTEDDKRAFSRVVRNSVSPGAYRDYMRMNLDIDVSAVLPSIGVPTLVLHRAEIPLDVRNGRYLADHIPGARFVELPGRNFAPQIGDQEALFAELEHFFAEIQSGEWKAAEPDRVLSTVLFTDIVGSSEKAASLGDRAWRELLEQHHDIVRRQLLRFRGKEVDTAGDGFFASFDGPARAIHCACAIAESMPELGLDVRVGLHTGECEIVDGKVAGIAVHTGARVAAKAQPGEVLVSGTVKDLVAGSGLVSQERGQHQLKGIPGEWLLYAVGR